MKIGTLTFHRACNNGALLQAYALEKALDTIEDVEAEIINYKCNKIDYAYTPQFCFYNCSFIKGLIKFLIRYRSIINRNKQFEIFRRKYLKISDNEYNRNSIFVAADKYDLIICGSDQVWNYELTGEDDTYLLDFVKDSEKKATYAVSFGVSQINQHYYEKYSMLIRKIKYLSMREKTGAKLVMDLTGRKSNVHIDPVFLRKADEWKMLCTPIKERNYVLIYMVGMGNIVDEMVNFAKNMASNNNQQVLFMNTEYIPYLYPEIKHVRLVSPDMFLTYIYHAECVVTNSFHATCFSILFHKKFYTEMEGRKSGDKKSDRSLNLLKKCELSKHIIRNGIPEYDGTFNDDWDRVDQIIADEVKISMKYLREMVEKKGFKK